MNFVLSLKALVFSRHAPIFGKQSPHKLMLVVIQALNTSRQVSLRFFNCSFIGHLFTRFR